MLRDFVNPAIINTLKNKNPEWAKDLNRRAKEYRQSKRGKRQISKSARKCHLKSKFGISIKEYKRLERGQKGFCAICGEKQKWNGRNGKRLPLVVDHCHKTGRIRGLLCSPCNIAIHKAERNERWFEKAELYLRKKTTKWWLQRDNVEAIAKFFEIDIVPIIGEGTLFEMVEKTRKGFNSICGSFLAEGIVARPKTELLCRNGSRLITKIKHRDFK